MHRFNRPIVALIVANIIMGISIPILKLTLTQIPMFTLLFIRFFVAGLVFLPLALPHWKPLSRRDLLLISGVAILGITIHLIAIFLALPKTSSINVSLLFSAGPVVLYFLSVKYLKEKPNARILGGMVIALVGVLFIIVFPLLGPGKAIDIGKMEGSLLVLAGLFAHTIAVLLQKKNLQNMHPAVAMSLMCLIGVIGFIPGMVHELGTWSFSQLTIWGWVGVLFGTFVTSVVAHYLLTYGLSKVNAEEVGLFVYIDPVATALIAIPLLGEIPGLDFYAGALLVFGGIFLAEGRLHWHPIDKLKFQSSNVKS